MRRLLMAGAAALAFLGPASADTTAQVSVTPRVVVLNPDGSIASFANIGIGGSGGSSPGIIFWTEFAAQQQAVGANVGASRSSGATVGTAGPYAYFEAQITSSVSGTMSLVNENNPSLTTQTAIPANTLILTKVPALGSTFHVVFSPSAAATVSLSDGYSN